MCDRSPTACFPRSPPAQLKDFKQELAALRVAKLTGGAPSKISKMCVQPPHWPDGVLVEGVAATALEEAQDATRGGRFGARAPRGMRAAARPGAGEWHGGEPPGGTLGEAGGGGQRWSLVALRRVDRRSRRSGRGLLKLQEATCGPPSELPTRGRS